MENLFIIKFLRIIIGWIQNQFFFIVGYGLIAYSVFMGAIIFAIRELIIGILFISIGLYVRKVEWEIRDKAE